ncbi:MAG: alpha/beta hydrolase [Candidatus Thiodiazotropha sp.]
MTKTVFGRYFAIVSALLIIVGLAASWIVAGELVAPMPRAIGAPPKDLPIKSVSFASESGSVIAGWHIPVTDSKATILLLHGIRGSRLSMLERARWLYANGYSILMIDFQAHGESPGEYITIGYLEKYDVKAAVGFARNLHPNESLGVLGVSLGGASAVLASPLDVEAVILESVYPNIDNAIYNRVSAKLGMFSMIPAELLLIQLEPRLGIPPSQLRPIDNINRINSPVLLISGAEDRHTTVEETQAIFDAALQPKQLLIVEGAAHEDLYRASPGVYKDAIIRFFNRYL